jgi:ADP-ribosylglycohydrolase
VSRGKQIICIYLLPFHTRPRHAPPLAVLPTTAQLRKILGEVINDKGAQGHVVDGLVEELHSLHDSHDALIQFGERLSNLPLRADWPYVEPDDLDAINEECDPDRPRGRILDLSEDDLTSRIEAAFLGRICGCMLGKPFEINTSFDEIRSALEPLGEWPLVDYPSREAVFALKSQQPQWPDLVRGDITHVAPDDDINYTVLAMLVLEENGADFTHNDLRRVWMYNLPILATFGPERTILLKSGVGSLADGDPEVERWVTTLNPGDELCGALIRADAYGYACMGNPSRAAELAFRDASFTHRRTGIYGAMFISAAIAAAPAVSDPIEIFELALRYVPQTSRFAEQVRQSIEEVRQASDWIDGYQRINSRFGEFGFCRIVQEVGTLINTLRFAESVGDGICKQVSQGLDTDSFGATAGSILGAYFGPGHLEDRWTRPFNNDIHLALALFRESSLSRLTERMTKLPQRIN